MRQPLLIHHAANRGPGYPPNSLAGIRACLAGAQAIEVDVQPLADGEFALLHDALLDGTTTGCGAVSSRTSGQLAELRLMWQGQATGEPVPLLGQVVALLRGRPAPAELQLDLKAPLTPPTEAQLRSLARLVEPLGSRVRVSSEADWALRRLHALAPWIGLGFDPLLYLDLHEEGEEEAPPYRIGAYGYRDDHPLAVARWGSPAEYLAERAEVLWAQAPMAGVWYLRATALARTLEDGFDWIGFLHRRGALVTAWTLDADRPGHAALARRLLEAGVDRLTTNDPPALAEAVGGGVEY